MKIIIAPDSFKGTISSQNICKLLKTELQDKFPRAEILPIPVSDGGEGFVEALSQSIKMELIEMDVFGPLNEIVSANYGIANGTAYLEMAQSSGLQLLEEHEKDPLKTSTFGFGEIISDAIGRGIFDFVIGIGGSSTNDAGAGMAQAHGYKFFDSYGQLITDRMNNELLGQLSKITSLNLPKLNIKVACDVKNPLLGDSGATYTYAKQKGARNLEVLEKNMLRLQKLFVNDLQKDIANIPGSGAAGGLGAGLMVFLDAELVSGSKLVLDVLDFDNKINDADLIITGEGKFDSQTEHGKIISEIIVRAKSKNIPVYGIFGIMENSESKLFEQSIQLVDFADVDETMNNPEKYLKIAVNKLFEVY